MLHPETMRGLSGPHEIQYSRFDMRELQKKDCVEAITVEDIYENASVTATLEKSNKYKEEKKPCQDAFVVDAETGLVAVLDGVGSTAGDMASSRGAEILPRKFKEAKDQMAAKRTTTEVMGTRIAEFLRREDAEAQVEKFMDIDPAIIQKAYQLAYSFVLTHNEVKETGASTTLNAGLLHTTPDGRTFYIGANGGDSVAYLQLASGRVEKLTQEDSLETIAIKTGVLTPGLLAEMQKDPKKAHTLTATKELLQGMGIPEADAKKRVGMAIPITYRQLKSAFVNGLGGDSAPRPSVVIEEVFPGDKVILVTDGISDMFESANGEPDTDGLQEALEGKTEADSVNKLRATAGKRTAINKDSDDRSAVMLSIHEVAEEIIDELQEVG